jgi:hypothetical protein
MLTQVAVVPQQGRWSAPESALCFELGLLTISAVKAVLAEDLLYCTRVHYVVGNVCLQAIVERILHMW